MNDRRFTRIRDTIDPAIASFVTTEIIAGKSVLDTKLVVDAVRHEAASGANEYVIVSGDSDMVPLVRTLQERGRRVIGAGRGDNSSGALQDACDQWIWLTPPSHEIKHKEQTSRFNPEVERLRTWIDELLGEREEVPPVWLSTELNNRVRRELGVDPSKHYRDVLQVTQFKKVLAALHPDGAIRLSESGRAVIRGSREAAKSGPTYLGLGPSAVQEAAEYLEPELPKWDPERMSIVTMVLLPDE